MNKKILLLALSAFYYQIIFMPVFAVKAYPFPFVVHQPDGSELTVRLQGDEFHHYTTSDDGYLLKANSKGYLTYANVNIAGVVVASEIIARDVIKRTASEIHFLKSVNQTAILQKTISSPSRVKAINTQRLPQKVFPLAGSPKSLVILVNFTDTTFVIPSPQMAYTNLLNQVGYSVNAGTGSARDYFMASSYSKFTPDFNVFGPVNLPHTMAYYGANDSSGNDTNAVQMIVDACYAAHNAGLDFSTYDTDNDGFVDNVFVYYAGHNEAERGSVNSIWPHRWGVYPQFNYNGPLDSITFNGKQIMDYACTSELRSNTGASMCGIGTFCHEFGHVLGLPDYYDTSGSTHQTLASWSIMDNGTYSNLGRTPPVYSAFDRFFLGWLTPEQKSAAANLTLNPIYQGTTIPTNTINQAFLLSSTTHNMVGSSPSPNEFFILEYRQKTGWDTFLPAEGMCIWHIDYDKTAWDDNTPNSYSGSMQTLANHMRVYLQPLIGSTTTPGTAFTTGSFTPTTWSGVNYNMQITDITKTTGNVTFKLINGVPPSTIATSGIINPFATTVGSSSSIQSVAITGAALTDNLVISLTDKTQFDMKLPSQSIWTKSLTLVPAAGSVSETLQIRYNPSAAGFQTDQLTFTSAGSTTINLNVNGTASIPSDPTAPAIIVGKIDYLIQFPISKPNVTNTKVFNIKTTDITDTLSLSITGTDAAMFVVSVSSLTKDAVNASTGTSITITYLPTSVGAHTATLTISGGGLIPAKVVSLQGEGK